MIVGIDPGTERSAVVTYERGKVHHHVILDNDAVLRTLSTLPSTWLVAIEFVASFGMPVGKEVFETVFWVGRFWQYCDERRMEVRRIYRADVKTHLCHSQKANDAAIRQALIDRFGPGKEKAIGRKKTQGPLYGLKADEWSALAIAVTAAETKPC